MKKLISPILFAALLGAAPSDRDLTVIVPSLRGLVFLSDSKDFKKSGVDFAGVSLTAVPLLDQPAFVAQVTPYLGHPVTMKDLDQITAKAAAFCKTRNHPVVDVAAPEQDISSGVIQLIVNEFRVGEVRVEGNHYFSSSIVSNRIHFEHGDTIDSQRLLSELDAANSNPFRRVDMTYQPSAQPGYTDLVLNTQDRFPLNVFTGFDNSGTPATGRSRWNFGASYSDPLWHDQQITYEFSSSDNFFTGGAGAPGEPHGASFLGHTLSWTLPLRENDSITIFGNYQKSLPLVGDEFGYVGKSGQASARYNLGLHRTAHLVQTLQFGYDFKTTNNNLDFGGTQVSRNTAEVDQFPIAYAANITDAWGASSLTSGLTFSPGGLTPNNHSSDFQPASGQSGIPGAVSRYTYWRTDFTRLTKLPSKTVWAFRALGQLSSANLLYTEKLIGGGPDILRGYDPNSVLGDNGFIMSNELRSPTWKPAPEHNIGGLQFVAFWDYGHLVATHSYPGVVNSLNASSVGTGARYNLRTNLTGRFDYGWQLIHLPDTNSQARSHLASVGLTLAY